jgi:hypothetical protein
LGLKRGDNENGNESTALGRGLVSHLSSDLTAFYKFWWSLKLEFQASAAKTTKQKISKQQTEDEDGPPCGYRIIKVISRHCILDECFVIIKRFSGWKIAAHFPI